MSSLRKHLTEQGKHPIMTRYISINTRIALNFQNCKYNTSITT